MQHYAVTARRINDRPDEAGWRSSGTQVPTFTLAAPNADGALSLAHRVLGEGVTGITRTVVDVFCDAPGETVHSSTFFWANGHETEPTAYRWQHSQDGTVRVGGLYDRDDADEATAFTADGTVLVNVARSPRGKWRITTSDHARLLVTDYRRRFAQPDDALSFAATRMSDRTLLIEVDEF